MQTYDVIVLGAGSTGENVADRVVGGGLTAVLVESELVGGECSYWACMPSKALLRGPEAVAAARAVDGAAQAVSGDVDAAATLARRTKFTSDWNDESQVQWATSNSIDVLRGSGRITGERTVRVTGSDGTVSELTATHAVAVCTGSVASLPPIPGLADARPWTPREATSAQRVPGSLVIIGGGVVGCELATAWRALGAEVTVLEVAEGLLAGNEPFAGELVAAALRDSGVDVRTGASISEVRRDGDGPTTVVTDDGEITAEVLLVAAGRRAGTDDVGLDAIGLEVGSWLEVDDTCRVTAVEGGWLYAVGDVNHRALLTHMGKYQARACGAAIVARSGGEQVTGEAWSRYAATADHAAVPGVVFTEPPVASVGLTEKGAREDGMRVRVVECDLAALAGSALYSDSYTGRAKIVVDEDRQVIVGATFVGPGIGELLHSATVAVVGEVPLDRLWHAVPSYPTISEIWLRLLEEYGL
ncbi:MAG: NAD(P)/FAD-dependent oxidoreductase [Geodermatophilaceae bacterium]|nr:NAD(P)/FAD-dependent oxidoreductase [Geodermatophilaceae bacterium]